VAYDDFVWHNKRLYNRPGDAPLKKIVPYPGIQVTTQYMVPLSNPSAYPKRQIDWFIHFCGAHGCDQQTQRHTETEGTEHATSLARGRTQHQCCDAAEHLSSLQLPFSHSH